LLRFERICKAYGAQAVLRDLSHHFSGGAFALRGPNGIGKSTLLAVLAGAEEADSGAIWIDGQPLRQSPVAAKARLAYTPDACPVYPFMRGRELLQFVAFARRCALAPEVTRIVSRLVLDPHLETRFGDMSLGTQKKMMLAAAWIGDPAVMLLDEPSNGLDAEARAVLAELLKARAGRGVVLISTHDDDFVRAVGACEIAFADLAQRRPPQEAPVPAPEAIAL
jgi:ABC-2 type transport system ATP-binding protein